jgi:hypothetical protein
VDYVRTQPRTKRGGPVNQLIERGHELRVLNRGRAPEAVKLAALRAPGQERIDPPRRWLFAHALLDRHFVHRRLDISPNDIANDVGDDGWKRLRP